MKKIFLALSLLLTVAVTAVLANEKKETDPRVLASFNKEFAGAQNVTWDQEGDFYKARFVIWGHTAVAYFTEEGELAGCCRDIFFDQLPLMVMTSVNKRFAGAEVDEVREITNPEGTFYRLTIRVSDKKLIIKAGADGIVTEIKKAGK